MSERIDFHYYASFLKSRRSAARAKFGTSGVLSPSSCFTSLLPKLPSARWIFNFRWHGGDEKEKRPRETAKRQLWFQLFSYSFFSFFLFSLVFILKFVIFCLFVCAFLNTSSGLETPEAEYNYKTRKGIKGDRLEMNLYSDSTQSVWTRYDNLSLCYHHETESFNELTLISG